MPVFCTFRSTLCAAASALFAFTLAHAQSAASTPPAATTPAPMAAPAPAPMAAPAPAPMAKPAPAPKAESATTAIADVYEGKVAYYSSKFNGRKTASGERFNSNALTMAHKSLPFGTRVRVTNLANKRSVIVRVNDRGPTSDARVGDLSLAAAKRIGATRVGVIDAKLEVVGQAKAAGKKKKG